MSKFCYQYYKIRFTLRGSPRQLQNKGLFYHSALREPLCQTKHVLSLYYTLFFSNQPGICIHQAPHHQQPDKEEVEGSRGQDDQG